MTLVYCFYWKLETLGWSSLEDCLEFCNSVLRKNMAILSLSFVGGWTEDFSKKVFNFPRGKSQPWFPQKCTREYLGFLKMFSHSGSVTGSWRSLAHLLWEANSWLSDGKEAAVLLLWPISIASIVLCFQPDLDFQIYMNRAPLNFSDIDWSTCPWVKKGGLPRHLQHLGTLPCWLSLDLNTASVGHWR